MIKTETGYMITRDDLDADGWYKASDDLIVEGNLTTADDVRILRVRGSMVVNGNDLTNCNQTVGSHQTVRGYQDVSGNQYVGGNQTVSGNQDVSGNQYVGGYQYVRGYQNVGGNQDISPLHFCCTRHFTGLYRYHVMAAITKDGTAYVHMGCLRYSLEEWEIIGIRKSNLKEFPDNGSEQSEDRVRAFEFAKSIALELKPR